MEFTINGKTYELKFKIAFIRQLDERFKVNYQGLEFGMGIIQAMAGLQQKNPTVLADVIKAAATHSGKAPKQYDVDDAIDEHADEHDGLEQLFADVIEEMGKSKTVKATLDKMNQTQEEQGEAPDA